MLRNSALVRFAHTIYRSDAFFRAPRSGQMDETLHHLSIPVQSWLAADVLPSQSDASAVPTQEAQQSVPHMRGGMKRPAAKPAAPAKGKPAAAKPAFRDMRDRVWYKTLSEKHQKVSALRAPDAPQLRDAIRPPQTSSALKPSMATSMLGRMSTRCIVPPNFRFTCVSCVPNTCSWAGYATYVSGLKDLEIWVLPADQHGQPSHGPSNRGRKRKQEAEGPNSWIVPGEVMDDDALRGYIKDHLIISTNKIPKHASECVLILESSNMRTD